MQSIFPAESNPDDKLGLGVACQKSSSPFVAELERKNTKP